MIIYNNNNNNQLLALLFAMCNVQDFCTLKNKGASKGSSSDAT